MSTGANTMTPAQQAAAINSAARAAIKNNAVKMQQLLTSGNIVPANTPVLTINPRNVGLLLGFWAKITHTISNGSGVQLDLTDFGPANALAQIQVQDFNNVTRIQTSGWHLNFVNSVRGRRPMGSSLVRTTGLDTPVNYGDNWTGQISAPATIAASGSGTVTMWYWIPLAYSDDDLRGSIYANVVNATMQILLSMPGSNGVQVAVANGSDSTQAMYVGDAAGSVAAVSITNTAYEIYQYYYDQLPVAKGGVLLPITDLATVYELKYTIQGNVPANQDFGYQYGNFRNILSTFLVYVHSAAGVRGVGADINYLSLQAANTTNIWKKTPALLALEFRQFFGMDMPPGAYYFGSRQRPIITTQYGNMQLIINASVAATGAYELVAIEDFALIQTLSMAGSLPTS